MEHPDVNHARADTVTVRVTAGLAIALSGAWLVCSLLAYSNAAGPTLVAWVGVWFFGFLLGVFSLGNIVILIVADRVCARRWEWAGVVAAPFALGLWLYAVNNDLPLRARIATSDAQLLQFAETAPQEDAATESSTRVGMFNVRALREVEGCFFFTTKRGWFFSTAGLAICRDGQRPIHFESGMVLSHVTGPWWEWESHD
jgi:hypothetical protein